MKNGSIARVAVHAVNEVHRVDQSHAGEDRQRDADPGLYLVHPPQPVQVVDIVARLPDEDPHQHDLHHEAESRRQFLHVVPHADDQHHRHRHQSPGEDRLRAQCHQQQTAREDARVDHQATHHRHRHTLQLTSVGIVHDVMVLGKLQHEGEHQCR